jgi:hypothetical protein
VRKGIKMTEIKLSEIKSFVEKRLLDLVEYDEETGTFSRFLEFLRENTLSNFLDFKNLEAVNFSLLTMRQSP